MAVYTVEVFETRSVLCLYKVEAGSLNEATQKAATGETIAEEDIKNYGVLDRHVEGEPELVTEAEEPAK